MKTYTIIQGLKAEKKNNTDHYDQTFRIDFHLYTGLLDQFVMENRQWMQKAPEIASMRFGMRL